MNFRDTLVTCQECGQEYIFTVEQQRKLSELDQKVEIPDMCQKCTHQKKYGGRLHGRIKWFNLEKGYGFIVEDSGGEIFVHRNSLQPLEDGSVPPVEEGQEVLYDSEQGNKGPQAVKVVLLSSAS